MLSRIEMCISGVLVTVTTFVSDSMSHVVNIVHQLLNEIHFLVTGIVGHVSVLSGGVHTPASSQVAEAIVKKSSPTPASADAPAASQPAASPAAPQV